MYNLKNSKLESAHLHKNSVSITILSNYRDTPKISGQNWDINNCTCAILVQ